MRQSLPRGQQTTAREALAVAERDHRPFERAVDDVASLGHAHRVRAQALWVLHRPEEALAAFREVQRTWKSMDAVPEQIEALGAQGLLFARTGDEDAVDSMVEHALSIARSEARRPVAAASMLTRVGFQMWQVGRLVAAPVGIIA